MRLRKQIAELPDIGSVIKNTQHHLEKFFNSPNL
jgi:hypothetical protein